MVSGALLGSGTSAQAESYSTVGVTANLMYSSMDVRAKRMGHLRGNLRVRDDLEFSRLELGGREYPIELQYFRVGRASRRASGRFEVDGDTLRELVQSLNRSIWRSHSTKASVTAFIQRQDQLGEFSGSHVVAFESLPRLDFDQPDLTIHRVKFRDDTTSEVLTFSLDFESRARLD